MKFNTQNELFFYVIQQIERDKDLAAKHRDYRVNWAIGFYDGYCTAMGWTPNNHDLFSIQSYFSHFTDENT